MFASLRVRNYRFFALGQVVSLIGTWGQRVAQDWLVLELSGGSPVALGIAVALQFSPTLLLSLWAGVLADRYDKRRLLITLQIAMGLCALALGLLDVTGVVQLWQVYLLCLLLGGFSAVDLPVRQAFAMEMVGRAQVTNVVALNSMTFNMARIVGPAVAGLAIVAVGTGWVFLINAVSFAAVVTGLLLMNPARLYRTPPVPRRSGQLREGLGYVRRRADLMVLLTLVFFVATFGLNFHVMLPVVARNVFDKGADAYGLLATMLAVGTLAGATFAARRSGRGRPRLRLVFGAALAFGLLEVAVGLMPSYAAFGLMLVPCGAAALTFTTAANATVQLTVDPWMRGRVLGLYMLLFLGGNPVGAPLMGWVAEEVGGRAPIVLGGAMTVLATLVCAVLARRSRGPAGGSPTTITGTPGAGRLRANPQALVDTGASPVNGPHPIGVPVRRSRPGTSRSAISSCDGGNGDGESRGAGRSGADNSGTVHDHAGLGCGHDGRARPLSRAGGRCPGGGLDSRIKDSLT